MAHCDRVSNGCSAAGGRAKSPCIILGLLKEAVTLALSEDEAAAGVSNHVSRQFFRSKQNLVVEILLKRRFAERIELFSCRCRFWSYRLTVAGCCLL